MQFSTPPSSRAGPIFSNRGLSRLDIVVALAVVAILGTIALPGIAATQQRSEMAACNNNLRILGVAMRTWANDHHDQMPWRVPVEDGGHFSLGGRVASSWVEFLVFSNQLDSPRVLACPNDLERRPAFDFTSNPNGGLSHFDFRNNSVSYFIGLDVSPDLPASYLCGERNIPIDNLGEGCSSGVVNTAALYDSPGIPRDRLNWGENLHGGWGNVLSIDGRVVQLSSAGLRKDIPRADDNGRIHLLLPQ